MSDWPVDPEKEIQAAISARAIVEKRLEEAGLTRPYYISKLKELCEATKPISCVKGKDADGGTVDFIDIPDNRIQLDAVKTIIDLYGDKAPTKQNVQFPDKNGHPQAIGGGMFTDLERAARLAYLLDQAAKRGDG